MVRRVIDRCRAEPHRDPRPALINLFTYTAMMMLFIEVQVVVKQQGAANGWSLQLTQFLIGFATTSYHLFFFLCGLFFGRLGDFVRRRFIVFGGCVTASLGVLIIGLIPQSYIAVVIGRALTGLGMGMLPGALFASTVERKASVGLLTALGSLGWTVGSFLAPGLGARPLTFFIAAGLAALPAFLGFSFREFPSRPKTRFISLEAIRRHWPIYLGFFLRHAGAMSIWVTFTLFLKQRGADIPVIPGWRFLSLIGLIYALNPFCQFFFMLVIERIKPKIALPVGYLASAAVFFGYAVVPNPWLFIPLQIVLAFTWAALYLGSLIYLNRRCAEERSTVSGAFNAIVGLCGITGSLLGGVLSGLFYELSMIVAGVMSIAGLLVVVLGEKNIFSPRLRVIGERS